jgi:tRNA(Ile)-lysidine synthase
MRKDPPSGYEAPHLLAGAAPDLPLAVALSGGADSVALLHLLKTHHTGALFAMHVHHGIRGEEADRDADFCRALCERLDVPLSVLHVDVPALAAAEGLGLESAARIARYEALAAEMKRKNIPLLATAHHADDQLETMLQHLLRGAGTRGLCGIPAVRPLQKGARALVVRPLLQMTKQQILAYCTANGLDFVTDSTNGEPCCPRNRLRAEVVPVLRELWPAGASCAARAAASLAEDEAYFQTIAADFLAREGNEPPVRALAALPRPVFARVMRQLLPPSAQATHIGALWALVQAPAPHKSLSLPAVCVQIEQGRFTVREDAPREIADYEIPLREGVTCLPCGIGVAVLGEKGTNCIPDGMNVYRYETRIDFCSAIMKGNAVLRNRRAGDRILSGKCHKAVRKLPCMAQFSLETRERMPLLCDGEGVLAVPLGPVRDGAKQCADKTLYLFFN